MLCLALPRGGLSLSCAHVFQHPRPHPRCHLTGTDHWQLSNEMLLCTAQPEIVLAFCITSHVTDAYLACCHLSASRGWLFGAEIPSHAGSLRGSSPRPPMESFLVRAMDWLLFALLVFSRPFKTFSYSKKKKIMQHYLATPRNTFGNYFKKFLTGAIF